MSLLNNLATERSGSLFNDLKNKEELIDAQVWSEKRVVGYSCQQLFKVVSEVQYDTPLWYVLL